MDTLTRKREYLILFAAIIASGMAFLDGSVVNIAIPAIQNQFHASFDGMLWVINAFPLFLASLLLVSGSLSDRFGRKKVFVLGIIVFTLSSILCALAQSIMQLAIYRSLQGIGAAMMIPGSLTILSVSIPENRRGRAIGLWSGFSGGIAAVGPFVGGWLTQTFSWRAIFFINLPLGLLALALSLIAVTESKNSESRKLDVWGTLLILLGLFGISYGLMTAPVKTWQDWSVITGLGTGLVCLIAFIFVERKTAEPLVPPAIFKSRLVLGSNLATLFLYGALNSLIFFVVLNMQQVQDFSPLKAGLALLPAVLIITFFSGLGGTVADRIGPRLPMIIGPLLVCAGTVWMIFAGVGADYFKAFLPGLILFGLGMAMVIAPLTKSALKVHENYSGAASGVNNAVARVAALLAVAVLGAAAISFFGTSLRVSIGQTSLGPSEKQQILGQSNKLGGIEVPEKFTPQEKIEAKTAVKRSFVGSFRIVLAITALLAFISSIISAIFITKQPD